MNNDTRVPWEPEPNNTLTPDVNATFDTSISKLGCNVLRELYYSPQIQHKTLAAHLDISPSSLSNLLSKLETIEPQLLEITPTGRSKYYRLTDIAETYVKQKLLPKTSNIHPFPPQQQKDLGRSALDLLSQFQTIAGRDWQIILDDMLIGNTSANGSNSAKLYELYENFLENMKQLQILRQIFSIQEVQSSLNNNILVHRLETRLETMLKNYNAMKPLFTLAKQNPELATQFIDYTFTEIRPHYFPSSVCPISSQNRPIDGEQYTKVFYELLTMTNEFSNYQGDKPKVLEYWKVKYCSSDIILNYIAEKCYMIYILEQRSS